MLIYHLIFIFWCQTQMFSVYSKNKGIGLTVPILLEGSVYQNDGISNEKKCRAGLYFVNQELIGSLSFANCGNLMWVTACSKIKHKILCKSYISHINIQVQIWGHECANLFVFLYFINMQWPTDDTTQITNSPQQKPIISGHKVKGNAR